MLISTPKRLYELDEVSLGSTDKTINGCPHHGDSVYARMCIYLDAQVGSISKDETLIEPEGPRWSDKPVAHCKLTSMPSFVQPDYRATLPNKEYFVNPTVCTYANHWGYGRFCDSYFACDGATYVKIILNRQWPRKTVYSISWYIYESERIKYYYRHGTELGIDHEASDYEYWLALASAIAPVYRNINASRVYDCTSLVPPTLGHVLRRGFRFNEPAFIRTMYGSVRRTDYEFQWLQQHSFKNAMDALPTLNDNNLANIIDVANCAFSIVKGKGIRIPKRWEDVWLSYRYSYGTTIMDIEDAMAYLGRMQTMPCDIITTHGSSKYDDMEMLCHIKLRNRTENVLNSTILNASRLGILPDAYMGWDFIPFSFIADWFIPFGEVLDAWDASHLYTKSYYDFISIGYSLRYQESNLGIFVNSDGKYYSRWYEASPPIINCDYWFDKGDQSTNQKTILFRAIDATALISGSKRRR